MKDKTFSEWTRELANSQHKYGGGSAASVVGAFAANLAEYVFGFQLGKKKYEENQEEIKIALEKAARLSDELLDLAEEDADAFAPVMPLFSLPKDTEEERKIRQEKIDRGLTRAARSPLNIMFKMDEVMDLFEQLIYLEVKGSIVDDIVVGLIFTEAVIESEKINCQVNIKAIKNETVRQQMLQEKNDTYQRILARCLSLKEKASSIH